MLKQNKNSIYSFLSLIFVVISYIGLDKLMYSNFYIQGNSLTSKFDWFFFSLTKYKWNYASGDILYYLALLIPFIFLILSVFWGIKMLKNKIEKGNRKIKSGPKTAGILKLNFIFNFSKGKELSFYRTNIIFLVAE